MAYRVFTLGPFRPFKWTQTCDSAFSVDMWMLQSVPRPLGSEPYWDLYWCSVNTLMSPHKLHLWLGIITSALENWVWSKRGLTHHKSQMGPERITASFCNTYIHTPKGDQVWKPCKSLFCQGVLVNMVAYIYCSSGHRQTHRHIIRKIKWQKTH